MRPITLKGPAPTIVGPLYDLRVFQDGLTTYCERHRDGSVSNCKINDESVSPEQFEAFMKELSGF